MENTTATCLQNTTEEEEGGEREEEERGRVSAGLASFLPQQSINKLYGQGGDGVCVCAFLLPACYSTSLLQSKKSDSDGS